MMSTSSASTEPAQSPLGIVVVNFAAQALIEANLGDLDLSAVPAKIIIVDNYSDDAERVAARDLCDRRGWTFVPANGNVGFGAGVNLGVERARDLGCRTLLLLNPDARISTDTAAALRSESVNNPMAMVAPRITSPSGKAQSVGNQVSMTTGRIRRLPTGADTPPDRQLLTDDAEWRSWLTGACVALSEQLWLRAGGMAEEFFLYWEDVDFSLRCRQAGGELILRRDLVVVHDEGGTQTKRGQAKSNLYYFYNCRNRLLFAGRHVSLRERWHWIWTTPAESWRILLRGGRRQLVQSARPLLATVRGSWAGLWLAVRP